jgi:glyoxylase-like metal-dependent hydrolase (beta-lactamase superfamily II)
MANIPLEDSFLDIVRKALSYAQMAAKIGDQAFATQSGIPIEIWRKLKNGQWDETYGPRAAEILGLNAKALSEIAHKSWHPGTITPSNLYQCVTPFSPTSVNAYVFWNPSSREAIIVDTGMDASPMLDFIDREALKVKMILLTHSDGDHVFELDRLMEKTGAPAFIHAREHLSGTLPIDESSELFLGNWKIDVIETPGHTAGGVTYLIRDAHPWIAFTGDAVMAGTMGKVRGDFTMARRVLQERVLIWPDDTILAPGHGPLSTVGGEKRHNPFLAATSRAASHS